MAKIDLKLHSGLFLCELTYYCFFLPITKKNKQLKSLYTQYDIEIIGIS